MSPVGIVFIIIGILIVLFGAFVTIYGFQEVTKNLTTILIIANIILVCATAASLYYAGKSNTRAERLFVGENRPLIDVTPVAISQQEFSQVRQVLTLFSIANYSGFTAYEIGIDLKYGEKNDWILEWRKAKNDKSGVILKKIFNPSPMVLIHKLKPGETKTLDDEEGPIGITGNLKLEDDVCAKGKKGLTVQIRITWKNKNEHIFDAVHQYKLICTSVEEGRAFNFVPEGIVSEKHIVIEGSRSEQKPLDS